MHECEISLNVGPNGPYYMISEESADQLPVVVRENVSEDKEALLTQGCVKFFTGWSLKLVLLLRFDYALCWVEQ